MQKIIISLSLFVSSILLAAPLYNSSGKEVIAENPLSNSAKSSESGGSSFALDSYKDGVGVRVVTFEPDREVDNTPLNNLVFKYGEGAKKNDSRLADYVLYGSGVNPTTSDIKLAEKLGNESAPSVVSIVLNGSSRLYSDGSYARTCNEYINPVSGKSYEGDTGDGYYMIDPAGTGAFNVWCDMTTDGGGWTGIHYTNDIAYQQWYSGDAIRQFDIVNIGYTLEQINSIQLLSSEGKQRFIFNCAGVIANYYNSGNNYDYSLGFGFADGSSVPQVGDKNLYSFITVVSDTCGANDSVNRNTVFDFNTKSVPLISFISRDNGDTGEKFGSPLTQNSAWLR
jgi:hypothetical protein